MKEFRVANFSEHPSFNPKFLIFLFQHSAPRAELARLQALLKGGEKVPGTLSNFAARLDALDSRVGWFERRPGNNNGNGYGNGNDNEGNGNGHGNGNNRANNNNNNNNRVHHGNNNNGHNNRPAPDMTAPPS
jgi:hypothetical protein